MAVPDPEDQDAASPEPGRPSSGRPGDDTEAAFAAIVAQWRVEPGVPHWPDEEDATAELPAAVAPDAAPAPPRRVPAAEDDHFVPPEPPPFPVPRPRTVGGFLLLALGLVLLAAPGLLGLGDRVGTPLGLLALTGGVGWLVLGLRSGPPPDSGWDDGAQL